MTRIVIINGLARGGTNLAANLFAAQDRWHVSDAAIAEITCIDKFLPKDFINHYPLALDHLRISALIDSKIEKFKAECIDRIVDTVCPSYNTIKTKYHVGVKSYYGISIESWGEYLRQLADIKSFSELNDLYVEFARKMNCDVLGHRTTALTSYADAFLTRSANHWWIEVTRDPFDRVVSSRKGHTQCLTQSFLQSRWQIHHISRNNHKNFIVITYEDLCTNPSETLEKVFAALGIESKRPAVTPITPDMMSFYGNSSENPDIFNQVEKEKTIYTDSIGTARILNNRQTNLGKSILEGKKPFFYLVILLLAELINNVGIFIRYVAVGLLALNYVKLIPTSGLRKVYSRCVDRFI